MTDAELLRAVSRERDPVNYRPEVWFKYKFPVEKVWPKEYEIKRLPRR